MSRYKHWNGLFKLVHKFRSENESSLPKSFIYYFFFLVHFYPFIFANFHKWINNILPLKYELKLWFRCLSPCILEIIIRTEKECKSTTFVYFFPLPAIKWLTTQQGKQYEHLMYQLFRHLIHILAMFMLNCVGCDVMRTFN